MVRGLDSDLGYTATTLDLGNLEHSRELRVTPKGAVPQWVTLTSVQMRSKQPEQVFLGKREL